MNDVALENKSGHEKHVQIGTFAGNTPVDFLRQKKGGGGPDILQWHTSTQRFRISLWVFLAISLHPTLSMWGIRKPSGHFPTGYFSKSPVGIDYVTHEQRQSTVEPRRNLVPVVQPAMCVSWQVARLMAMLEFVATFPSWPSEEPCPSDECMSLCVSTSHQQSLSFPGHWRDHVASGYGARVSPMTIVFSKSQMPFLTSICCLDIVRTHGNKRPAAWCTSCFYRGVLLSL